jgi:hypothetical protein
MTSTHFICINGTILLHQMQSSACKYMAVKYLRGAASRGRITGETVVAIISQRAVALVKCITERGTACCTIDEGEVRFAFSV